MINKGSHDPSPPARSAARLAAVRPPRQVQVIVILIAAAIVSGVAGLLSHAAGNNVPGSVLTAGAAFAGTTCLLLAIAHYAVAE